MQHFNVIAFENLADAAILLNHPGENASSKYQLSIYRRWQTHKYTFDGVIASSNL